MDLIVSPGALKQLRTMPVRDREALLRKARDFAEDPFGRHPWAEAFKGRADAFRLRQGDWRGIVVIIRGRTTVVLERVGNRREVYR